jgi:hypothetical protein
MAGDTHHLALLKSVRNRVYSQDMTELVPVVDVFLVGPVQGVEFLFHSSAEFMARSFLLLVVFPPPPIFLAKPFEFKNGRILGLILEFRISREEFLQWLIHVVRSLL